MRINVLQDGHVLRYCDKRVSQILMRNRHRDKNKDNFMENVAKTFPFQYILFILNTKFSSCLYEIQSFPFSSFSFIAKRKKKYVYQ